MNMMAGLRARRFTEADLRLYPTIVRYDGAYATLFKCCRRRVADYPNLAAWLRDVYQLPNPAPSSSALQVHPTVRIAVMCRQDRALPLARMSLCGKLRYLRLPSCLQCIWGLGLR